VATLTFVYSDSTAVVGPLATAREPHSWDLCVGHAGRITAPRGWELMRHAGPLPTHPSHPEDDDLVALADAVREGNQGQEYLPGLPQSSFSDSRVNHSAAHATAPSGGVLAPPQHRSGRRRGHLRVLPDPTD
jgi:hypothetical protein